MQNGSTAATEYHYDHNGNLTKDLNKNISNIQYNSLNLPSVVTFGNGNTITYLYTADGRKLRTVHVIGGTATTTDYCGNVIYENGTARLLLTEAGYIDLSDNSYHYYIKDHLGNNRVVADANGTVEESNQYYPFGLNYADAGSNVQPYKYNGKELDTKNGLNWYDYGARHYDAALGRWHVVDPLAEKYYSTSPYAYCLNNPVKYIDPDGKKIVIGTPLQRFLDKLGLNSYVTKVTKQLEQNNMDSKRIQTVYNKLEESEYTYKILPLSESPYGTEKGNHVIPESKVERGKSQGATMYYDPDEDQRFSGENRKARIGLAHELGHFEDFLKGNVISVDQKKKEKGDKIERYKTELNEQNSLSLENIIRKILDYGTRDSYYLEFKNE